MADLICDTNVFYNLGDGHLKKEDFVNPGDVIYYSPIAVLEITSKLSEKLFEQRKSAAKAIRDSGAKPLPDPESHLTRLFGNELAGDPFDVSPAVIALSETPDLSTLLNGVPDHLNRLVRRVVVDVAGRWRAVTDQQWLDEMVGIMEEMIPHFRTWYKPDPSLRVGDKPRLTGERKKEFLADTKTEEWLTTLIKACQDRSFYKAKRVDNWEPTAEFVNRVLAAVNGVACYVSVYTHYLIKLLTEGMMPQMNDSGDLELFLYAVDDNSIVVTSEKRWNDIATRAGYSKRLRMV